MSDLLPLICSQLEEGEFLKRNFPIITDWGVKDEDVMIHSLGCSVWNTLGHELGRMAIVEAPAPVAAGSDIRSDSVWFCKKNRIPEVLIEFERYDGSLKAEQKLSEKLSNLMEAYHRWKRQPKLLVLTAWSKGVVSPPDLSMLQRLFHKGFTNTKGVFIPGIQDANVLFTRFFFVQGEDGLLRLQSMSFWEDK